MSPIISGIIVIGSMIGFFMMGIPIAFSIALAALLLELLPPVGALFAMPIRMINGIDSFVLMAVPFFVLVGELMNRGGIMKRIFEFADDLVGHEKCGLGYVNIVASMIFSGMSGSSVADIGGLGVVELKAMEDKGYEKNFSAAITAASSTIGPIIPPSIPFVIYGSVTGVSIGRLLLGGAIPGVALGGLFMLYIFILTRFKEFPKPHSRVRLKVVIIGLKKTFPALLTPVILVGGIIFGFFTPTEAAAVASVYALFLGVVIYKELKWRDVVRAFISAALLSAQILFVISAAAFLGLVITKAQLPQLIFTSFISLFRASNVYIVLLVLNLLLILMGCVIDVNPMLIIVCPILAPIAVELGIDPIHFGVMIVFNLMLAILTPPVGMTTYVTCRVANVPIDTYTRALLPFLGVLIIGLILISLFPIISTFLPNLLLGYSK